MKKAFIPLIVTIFVLISTLSWFLFLKPENTDETIQFAIIILLVLFGFYIIYRRYKSAKSGEPQEDEMSKQLLQKSAALSFYISLYLWLVIMYLTDKHKGETEVMFGWGIIGMAVIYGLSWIFYYFRGNIHE